MKTKLQLGCALVRARLNAILIAMYIGELSQVHAFERLIYILGTYNDKTSSVAIGPCENCQRVRGGED